jgi:hypothetical protein
MRLDLKPLELVTENHIVVADPKRTLFDRALISWGRYCENPIATTATFAIVIVTVIVLAFTL